MMSLSSFFDDDSGIVPTTKEKNANLPCTPQEIADNVHRCAAAGAVFFHIHARDEHHKRLQPEIFREICRLVKQRDPEVILQISTGGRAPPVGVDVDENLWRINPLDLLPESGSFTPGSVNLEPIIYKNSPQLVQMLAEKYRETVRCLLLAWVHSCFVCFAMNDDWMSCD